MANLQKIGSQEFLQELKNRVIAQQLSPEEVFLALENPNKPEVITKYKKIDYSKFTASDWKKACESLAKDSDYQAEVKLWDGIDD